MKRGPKNGPSKWGKVDPVRVVKKMGELGATNQQMATALGISVPTLIAWQKKSPQLFNTIKLAKEEADQRVERGLFARATGFNHVAVKIMVVEGKVRKVKYIEQYPPDTTACIFWLKNRKPGQWVDPSRHEFSAVMTAPDGASVKFSVGATADELPE
jgi:hypothetical protein